MSDRGKTFQETLPFLLPQSTTTNFFFLQKTFRSDQLTGSVNVKRVSLIFDRKKTPPKDPSEQRQH